MSSGTYSTISTAPHTHTPDQYFPQRAKPRLCRIPRRRFGRPLRNVDVATTEVLLSSLLERPIWALYCITRVHEQSNWTIRVNIKWENEPRGPMFLHETLHRNQPLLSNREHEKPGAGSCHCSRSARSLTETRDCRRWRDGDT
jgi:hypothetical protein